MAKNKQSYINKQYVSDLSPQTKKRNKKSFLISTIITATFLILFIFLKVIAGSPYNASANLANGILIFFIFASGVVFIVSSILLIFTFYAKPIEIKCLNCGKSHNVIKDFGNAFLCSNCSTLLQLGGSSKKLREHECVYCCTSLITTNTNHQVVCPKCHSIHKIAGGRIKVIEEDKCIFCKKSISKGVWYCKHCNQFLDRNVSENKIALGAKSILEYMTYTEKMLSRIEQVYNQVNNNTPDSEWDDYSSLLIFALDICEHVKIKSDEQGIDRDLWVLENIKKIEKIVSQLSDFTANVTVYEANTTFYHLNRRMNKSMIPLFDKGVLKEWNYKKQKLKG